MITFHDIAQKDCVIKGGSLKNGYARAWFKGKTLLAHRVAWMKAGRELPEGLELHHLCRNRQCINVDHLKLVTRQEHNKEHGLSGIAKIHKEATHCKRGHLLDGKNAKQRYCKTCHTASDRAYRLRKGLSCPAI